MKLVYNVDEWKRWWSMRFTIIAAILATAQLVWPTLPSDWTSELPSWFKMALAGLTLSSSIAAAVARVIHQKPPEGSQ